MGMWIDRIAAGLLVLVGCVHNFVAAPMSFGRPSEAALWFVAGGVVLWFGGLINLIWLRNAASRRELWWAALLANLILLAFVVAFGLIGGEFDSPQGWSLLALVAWLTARSLPLGRLHAGAG